MLGCGHRESQEKAMHAGGPNCMKSVLMFWQMEDVAVAREGGS